MQALQGTSMMPISVQLVLQLREPHWIHGHPLLSSYCREKACPFLHGPGPGPANTCRWGVRRAGVKSAWESPQGEHLGQPLWDRHRMQAPAPWLAPCTPATHEGHHREAARDAMGCHQAAGPRRSLRPCRPHLGLSFQYGFRLLQTQSPVAQLHALTFFSRAFILSSPQCTSGTTGIWVSSQWH